MLKLAAALAASAAAVAIAAPAHASELYLRGSVGQTTNSSISGVNFNDGPAYGLGVGGKLGPVRIELGADHLSGDVANVLQGHAMDYSASGIIDIPFGHVTLSGGAGLDYVDAEVHGPFGGSYSASGNGWHYLFQASTRVADHLIVGAEYRHLSADLGAPGTLDSDQITAQFRVPL